MHVSRIQTFFAGGDYSSGGREVEPENILKIPVPERFIARMKNTPV